MKKVLALVLVLINLFLFVSCGKTEESATAMKGIETSSEIEKFYSYMEKGEYKKGADLYFDKIAVSSAGIDEVASVCTEIFTNMTSDYLAGKISKAEVERRMVLIREIEELVYVTNPYSEYESVCESKENYEKGLQYLANNSYEDAITFLKGVREDDCNYNDAISKIRSAKASYKNNILADVETKVNSKELIEAIEILTSANEIIEDDEEIKTLAIKYGTQYVNEELIKAEEAFITPATDWEASLQIINQAQQYFPENVELIKAEEYYGLFKPTSLFGLNLFNSKNFRLKSAKDNMGNVYKEAMSYAWSGSTADYYTGENITKPMSATYVLDGKYNLLTFVVAVESGAEANCYTGVEIYGDDRLLYSEESFDSTTKPMECSVDVSGVTDLTISLYYTGKVANTYYVRNLKEVIFAEPLLQRTVK